MSNKNSQELLQQFLLRVCADVVRGDLKPDGAARQIQEMQLQQCELGSVLSDILQAVDVEMDVAGDDEHKERFKQFCRLFSDVVPDEVINLALDSQIDEPANSKIIKTKTRLFYKQLKFNLLREESEGYAKIVTELSQDLCPDFNSQIALERVRCLIGQFNLDPNRVLDLILECFECRPKMHAFFVDLLRIYGASKDDICNLLGFKFTFHQLKFMSRGDVPKSLYRIAAILIHYRLIDLVPLCSFLSPNTDWILDHHKKLTDEAIQKAKKMQLVSVATLEQLGKDNSSDNSATSTSLPIHQTIAYASAEVTGKEDFSEADERYAIGENQKLGLTWALLDIGDWPLAKQILDRLPEFYAVRCMDIATALMRLVDRKIKGFYRKKCPEYCALMEVKPVGPRKDGRNKAGVKFAPSSNLGNEFWLCKEECVPIETWQELAEEIFPMAHYLGPGIGYGPIVLTKLIRILAAYIKEKNSGNGEEEIYCKVVDLVDEVLLPSLTVLAQNCALSEELWSVIGTFPYQTRYRLYGRWKNIHTSKHPMLVVKKGQIIGRTRYVMKRLSKETTKLIGRQLGKLSHTHPAVVFDYILNQVQTFENLIGPVVESVRYLSNLEFDVLSYCIIEHLASPAKEKLKVSDATLSPWLQSLATFVGSVFKKYNMELTGVLQYVANQLKAGKSFDLLVLREIIQNMSGIETTSALTQDQLEALAGGDLLRQEGGYFAQIRNIRRTTNRLKEALFQEDLVVGLCILMAQQRGSIVFREGDGMHLKLVGQMLDQCQDTLVQFGSFLFTNLKSEDYTKRMPAAPILMRDYHVAQDAAMFLTRHIYISAITVKYDELKKQDRANKMTLTQEKKSQHYKAAVSYVLDPFAEAIKPLFAPSVWQDISPKLFVTFWTLTMYDLNVPTASYDRELDRIKKSIQQLEENRELSESKKRKDRERLQQTESKLSDEQRRQQEHVNRVLGRLRSEKEDWFHMKTLRSSAVNQFMQLCLLPRCVFTDLDALFCAKFINVVHSMKTTSFNTLICFDRIFNDITPLIAGLSENEASYFGRFLCAMMEMMMTWHKDKTAFDKECAGYPGFITKFRNPSMTSAAVDDNTQDKVDYENFRHVVHKWHYKLTKSLLASLGSGTYVMIRNALIILIKILPYYPVLQQFHKVIEGKVTKIRDEEKEKRQDLSVLAASYWGHLKVRKSPLMNEEEFHNIKKPAVRPKPAVVVTKSTQNTSEPAEVPPKTTSNASVTDESSVGKDEIAKNAKSSTVSSVKTARSKPPEPNVKEKDAGTAKQGGVPGATVNNPKTQSEKSNKSSPAGSSGKPNKVHLHRTSTGSLVPPATTSGSSSVGSGSAVPVKEGSGKQNAQASGKDSAVDEKVTTTVSGSEKKIACSETSKLLPESIKITASRQALSSVAGSDSVSKIRNRIVRLESREGFSVDSENPLEAETSPAQYPNSLLPTAGKSTSTLAKKSESGETSAKNRLEISEGSGKEKKTPVDSSSRKRAAAVNGEIPSKKDRKEIPSAEKKPSPAVSKSDGPLRNESAESKRRVVEEKGGYGKEKSQKEKEKDANVKRPSSASRSSSKESRKSRSRSREKSAKKDDKKQGKGVGKDSPASHHHRSSHHDAPSSATPVSDKRKRDETKEKSAKYEADSQVKSGDSAVIQQPPKKIKLKAGGQSDSGKDDNTIRKENKSSSRDRQKVKKNES